MQWQTGGREKSSSTAAPSALLRVLSVKKFDFTCWRYQLCAPFSTFYENFSHNLALKKNSPVLDPSFSRPSTQDGRGTWLVISCSHNSQTYRQNEPILLGPYFRNLDQCNGWNVHFFGQPGPAKELGQVNTFSVFMNLQGFPHSPIDWLTLVDQPTQLICILTPRIRDSCSCSS